MHIINRVRSVTQKTGKRCERRSKDVKGTYVYMYMYIYTYITFLLSNSSALTCTTVQHCPAVDERPATCNVQSRKHYSLTPDLTAFTVLRAVWQRKSQGCSFWRVPDTYSLMNILNTSNKSARCQKAGPKKSHNVLNQGHS